LSEPASHRSRDELEDAIRNLSSADWGRLRKIAASYARSRPIEDEDLLQEAFRRTLGGGRKWPAGLDLVRFLAGAMKSIAHGELEKAEVRPTLVPLPNDGGVDPPHPAPSPEQAFAADQDAAAIKAAILHLFEEDPTAQIIVEGIMEGMEGEELRELTELDKTTYQSKRRYIRRHIDRKFPRGS
jgi:DNA-directed RNA polymerase specialized sigma24 family protein